MRSHTFSVHIFRCQTPCYNDLTSLESILRNRHFLGLRKTSRDRHHHLPSHCLPVTLSVPQWRTVYGYTGAGEVGLLRQDAVVCGDGGLAGLRRPGQERDQDSHDGPQRLSATHRLESVLEVFMYRSIKGTCVRHRLTCI